MIIMVSDYVLLWAEKVSLLNVDIFSSCLVDYIHVIGNNIKESIIYLKDKKILQAYCHEEDYKRIKREHGKYFLDKEKITKLLLVYDKIKDEFKKLVKEIRMIGLDKLSNKELSRIFKRYHDLQEKACAYYRSTRPEAEIKVSERLRNALSNFYSDEETEDKFKVLTESSEQDLIVQEKVSWLKILKLDLVADSVFLSHADRFPWLFMNLYDHDKAIGFLKNRYNEDKGNITKKEKEISGRA